MLFPSFSFLFMFLPIVLGCYYILPKEWRNGFLLLASIVFYGWEDFRIIKVLFSVLAVNYVGGLLISTYYNWKKWLCGLFVLADVAILGYFKYTNFLVEIISQVTDTKFNVAHIVLPLGISFYIFQAISYIVDVYRGECQAQTNVLKFSLYISFFPQLIAGPIIKYHEISEQIDNRTETLQKIHYGFRRFAIGLAKKVLLGNTLGVTVNQILSLPMNEFGVAVVWFCTLLYALQIYYDFSGYADMAVGLAAMFGFKIPENFNYPMISKTLTEYWQRWHISLGTWVKYYLYIPLGGSRCSKLRHYFNLFVVFFVIGIWHGATWNFILFGIYNAVAIVLEKLLGMSKATPIGFKRVLYHMYFFIMLIPITLLGKVETVEKTWLYMKKMFGFGPEGTIYYHFGYFTNNYMLITLLVSCVCMFPIFKNMLQQKGTFLNIAIDLWLFVLFLLSVASILTTSYNPFIYFRF